MSVSSKDILTTLGVNPENHHDVESILTKNPQIGSLLLRIFAQNEEEGKKGKDTNDSGKDEIIIHTKRMLLLDEIDRLLLLVYRAEEIRLAKHNQDTKYPTRKFLLETLVNIAKLLIKENEKELSAKEVKVVYEVFQYSSEKYRLLSHKTGRCEEPHHLDSLGFIVYFEENTLYIKPKTLAILNDIQK